MSHTIRKTNIGNSALVQVTFVDYVQGGESFTLAELGLTGGVNSIIFLAPASYYAPNQNVLPNFIGGGKVLLESGPGTEIPSTVGINLTFIAMVIGT